MFNSNSVPVQNAQVNQYLNNLYSQIPTTSDQKQIIDKKLEKVDHTLKDKIVNTVTISEYFDQLWNQPDLKNNDKDLAIKKLEAIHHKFKTQIRDGEQLVGKTSANLDAINAAFQMTPYEEYNYKEKIRNIKKKKKLDIESDLFNNHSADLDILYALNKPFRSVTSLGDPKIHYTSGLCDGEEDEQEKIQRAQDFIKKMREEKKSFVKKMKELEKNAGERELEELARLRKQHQQEEEEKAKQKKNRLEEHIKILKTKSEVRLKANSKWEDEYKEFLDKKPLFKEMEEKFNKGHLIPELEERKRKLQEIRDFHKPIPKEVFQEHEQKLAKLMEERERKAERSEAAKWSYQKPAFESKYHKLITEEAAKQKKEREEGNLEALKRKEKVMELLVEVREKHLPRADPQKELEMIGMLEKLKKKDWRSRTAEDENSSNDIDHKKLGAEYLKSVKEMVKKSKRNAPVKEEANSEKRVDTENGDEKSKVTTNSIRSEGMGVKKTNYLVELRKGNIIQNSDNYVDVLIKNKKMDEKAKKDLLKNEVAKLEEKAKKKELVKKHKKKTMLDYDEDEEAVDMIYINAIKAKIELIGN